jgi:hypothetical protein
MRIHSDVFRLFSFDLYAMYVLVPNVLRAAGSVRWKGNSTLHNNITIIYVLPVSIHFDFALSK